MMAQHEDGEAAKARPKLSKVWGHFSQNKEKKQVECRHCKAELSFHGSTTVMHEHLKRKHPGALSSSASSDGTKQRRVDDFFQRRGLCTPQMAEVLTGSILDMFLKDMRPISMVGDEGFKQMIHTFHPGYTLPSRTHFTKLMEAKYEATLGKVKESLKSTKNKISLTADAWTSVATEAYLGITCHFISDEWELNSFCLTTLPLEERHTGSNIAAWIEQTVEMFEIPPKKIMALVHDNGSNMVLAANILQKKHGWISVHCAGHTLQLIVNNALKHPQISKALGASRCLVEHFKRSELASSKLKAKQKQMGTPEHKLVQDISTRWNSTYYMMNRLLEQRWPLTATLSDPALTQRGKHFLDLKSDQWTLIEKLEKALQAFECATVYLSGESYVTVSALPPLVKGLLNSTHTVYDTTPVQAFQKAASEEISARWSKLVTVTDDNPSKLIIAAALDPRFRKSKFLPPEERFIMQSKVQALALQCMDGSSIVTNQSTNRMEEAAAPPDGHATGSPKKSPSRSVSASAIESLLGCDSTDSDSEINEKDVQHQVITNEVLAYFGEQPISKKENPLSWWKLNEPKYPTLASMAKSFLCIPATSTPSERLFSASGNIASKKRASLSPEHVNMLTFLHCNLKLYKQGWGIPVLEG